MSPLYTLAGASFRGNIVIFMTDVENSLWTAIQKVE